MKQLFTSFICAALIVLPVKLIAQFDYSSKEDQTPFRRMFDSPTIVQKKAIWFTLSRDEKNAARIQNYIWGKRYLNLTEHQGEYLDRFGNALYSITDEQANQYADEALKLFPADKRELLFGSIGPFTRSCGMVKIKWMIPNCWCSVGSSFNMSCETECSSGGGSCGATGDGCGFAYLFSCNGTCVDGLPHNDLTG